MSVNSSSVKSYRRCPNGTRRSKATGKCRIRRCKNGTRRNKKTDKCETKKRVNTPIFHSAKSKSKSAKSKSAKSKSKSKSPILSPNKMWEKMAQNDWAYYKNM